jgi:hypothetical protein
MAANQGATTPQPGGQHPATGGALSALHPAPSGAPSAPHTRGALGPYSRVIDRGALGSAINGSSREGRFLRAYEAELVDHCGGAPSAVQRALIVRACRLALHLELMDERALVDGKGLTTHDHNFYIAWSNSLARTLARLGVEKVAA